MNAPNHPNAFGFSRNHVYLTRNAFDMRVVVRDSTGLEGERTASVTVRTPASWVNSEEPTDTNRQNGTSPIGALLVINELTERRYSHRQTWMITDMSVNPPVSLDVDDDGLIPPLDALLVINALPSNNAQRASSSNSPVAAKDLNASLAIPQRNSRFTEENDASPPGILAGMRCRISMASDWPLP